MEVIPLPEWAGRGAKEDYATFAGSILLSDDGDAGRDWETFDSARHHVDPLVRAAADRLGVTGLAWRPWQVARVLCDCLQLAGEGPVRSVAKRIQTSASADPALEPGP